MYAECASDLISLNMARCILRGSECGRGEAVHPSGWRKGGRGEGEGEEARVREGEGDRGKSRRQAEHALA